jgi:1-acyl-sn-glycerol-3-phosphate acyltransferase
VDIAYRTTIGVARTAFAALGLRITVEGDDRVPVDGPVILAANHVSFLDFLLVGLAARRSRRHVRFLARHDIWQHPVVGPFLTAMRHVPVDPAAPAAAYLRARTLLRAGEAVAVFPEAGVSTSYTVRALMPGALALAAETGAPLLPVALWGPQRVATAHLPVDLRRGRPVSVLVGTPYDVPRGTDPRAATRMLGTTLQAMLDELQSRPAHRPVPGEHAPWHPAHLGGHAPTPQEAARYERVPRSAVPPSWGPDLRSGAWDAGG